MIDTNLLTGVLNRLGNLEISMADTRAQNQIIAGSLARLLQMQMQYEESLNRINANLGYDRELQRAAIALDRFISDMPNGLVDFEALASEFEPVMDFPDSETGLPSYDDMRELLVAAAENLAIQSQLLADLEEEVAATVPIAIDSKLSSLLNSIPTQLVHTHSVYELIASFNPDLVLAEPDESTAAEQ